MPYKPSEIERILQRKLGFEQAPGRSVDHHSFQLKLKDMPVIVTKVSHSKVDIGPKLEGLMARQLRVRTPFFRQVMDCTKSRDDYYHQVQTDPTPPIF